MDKGLTWKQHVQHIVTIALKSLLGLQGYVWSEANDDILDVHHYGKTNCFLLCPDVVAENQKEGMCERTH